MPDSPTLPALLALSRAHRVANLALDPALSRVGLWLDDLALLTLLRDAGEGGLTRERLAASAAMPVSEALRRARQFEKLGRVRRTDEGAFVLTADGDALVAEGSALAASAGAAWTEGVLDAAETATLADLLGRLGAARS